MKKEKSSSILRKFLLFNLSVFSVLGLFTLLYLKAIQPSLVKKRTANHTIIIKNTSDHIQRLNVTFDEKSTQAILTGSGTREPTLSYLPEDYQFVEDITVFASGKDGIFTAGTPIGKTTENGAVELFVDPNQLSFVTVNLIKPSKEVF